MASPVGGDTKLFINGCKNCPNHLRIVIPTPVKRARAVISARVGRRDLVFIFQIELYLCSLNRSAQIESLKSWTCQDQHRAVPPGTPDSSPVRPLRRGPSRSASAGSDKKDS